MCDTREASPKRPVDIFDVIVITCSLKNFDRSYRCSHSNEGMYYCTECKAMHHEWSRVGKLHKKGNVRITMVRDGENEEGDLNING